MNMKFPKMIIAGFAALSAAGQGHAELRVFPESITLDGLRDRHTIVVQSVGADGVTEDVTAQARIKMTHMKLASAEGASIRPLADGTTDVRVTVGREMVKVPLTVKNAGTRRDLSFALDVMPVFMRAGCNSGSCHGAARGQDGFRLSLFGYDPDGDFDRLTRELVGRRINVAAPEKSLLLEKSIGAVTHTGGELFKTDSQYYKTLHEWIAAGAKPDADEVAAVESIELLPEKVVVRESSETPPSQQMLVRAKYSDGSYRDVTSLAVFLSNNEATAEIDEHGVAHGRSAGGAFVFARFDKYTVGSELVVLPGSEFSWPKPPAANYIDELVYDKLEKLQLAPSEVASDEAFLRRAHLDLAGVPPTPSEFHSFVGDPDPDKRTKLVDRLLGGDEFVDLMAMRWGEMLRIKSGNDARYGRPKKAAWKYYHWLREQIAENRPVDEMVSELVAGTGSNLSQPTANFYTSASRQQPTPLQRGEDVAQLFLGTRIQCAQCHNHPVRPLDDGRLLRVRQLFCRRQLEDRRECARGLRLQQQRSEHGRAPGRWPAGEAEIPRRRGT